MAHLFLISTGPGDDGLLSPAARRALEESSEWVGYSLYFSLLGDLAVGKNRHELPLGAETERARVALSLAAAGHPTALISSGDIGIYAMATLVFELLDPANRDENFDPDWLQVSIETIPGISAMQAAASRCGAVLGHDFCTVSLSDLLTPWEVITNRLEHAAAGDFVVCFYNPVSRKRDWQLNYARDQLLKYRSQDTPVILGRNLTRDDERITFCALSELDASEVDMLTLVIVGNSETRRFINEYDGCEWIYTPRGYKTKSRR
ncbi:MAG: precorrin-3B C(17)-methyltransferase [Pseudomonadota bacterium]